MITDDILYWVAVVFYLALKDGYIYGKKFWQSAVVSRDNRIAKQTQRIKDLIQESKDD